MDRREFLRFAMSAAMIPAFPLGSLFDGPSGLERKLSFYNIHTGEKLETTYWSLGRYHSVELDRINRIMRDHRTGRVANIDPNLLDLLFSLREKVMATEPFFIISGYRSPSTNRMLMRHSNGVARNSLHMEGRAVDIRLPRIRLAWLRDAALDLGAGGVGYYPRSDFVHVDTGRPHYWKS